MHTIRTSAKADDPAQHRAAVTDVHAAAAERLLRGRQLRVECLGILNDGFGEPAWDMLLRLFIDDAHGRDTTIGALLREVGEKADVGRTYLGFLHSHRIVSGVDFTDILHGTDGDCIVRLTDRGRTVMTTYLEREEQ